MGKTVLHTGVWPVLSASDIRIIAQGTGTLPGNWHLDPVIDLRRWGKPRVWVRECGFEAADELAVSFERVGALIWVSLHGWRKGQMGMSEGMPLETFSSAFIYLWARLMAKACEKEAPPQHGLPWPTATPTGTAEYEF
jgi:hypothetical protein